MTAKSLWSVITNNGSPNPVITEGRQIGGLLHFVMWQSRKYTFSCDGHHTNSEIKVTKHFTGIDI